MIPLSITDVQDLIGKPHARGARGPDAYDCWGLCAEVYRRGGVQLPCYHSKELTNAEMSRIVLGEAVEHAEYIEAPENWCFVMDQRSGHLGLWWRHSVLHSARMLGCVVQRFNSFHIAYPRTTFARWRA